MKQHQLIEDRKMQIQKEKSEMELSVPKTDIETPSSGYNGLQFLFLWRL